MKDAPSKALPQSRNLDRVVLEDKARRLVTDPTTAPGGFERETIGIEDSIGKDAD